MKRLFVALITALALVPFVRDTASADDRYQGMVVIDGTVCTDKLDQTYQVVLNYGQLVSVFDGHQEDGKDLIGFGETGESCRVPIGSVVAWDGDSPMVEPQGSEIRWDFINADDVWCLTVPSGDIADIATKLMSDEWVAIMVDNVDDGWQLVGLEATKCYVWWEFIGPVTQPEEPTAEPTEVVEEESPPIESATPDTSEALDEEASSDSTGPQIVLVGGEPVKELPSTGSGDTAEDNYGWENLLFESVGGIVLIILFFGGGSLLVLVVWKFVSEHHLTERAKEARKNILRYFS